MSLFEDEIVNISKIHTIITLDSETEIPEKTINYNATLFSYELVFYFSGEIDIKYNGVNMSCTENSLVYLPKGAENNEYLATVHEDGSYIDIYFDTSDPLPTDALIIKNIPELKTHFTKIYNIWLSKRSDYYLECMTELIEIIKKIKNHNRKYFSKAQFDKIAESCNYMMENYRKHDFDYNEMCKKSGLSYSYFKELFISKYKMSPVKYITYLKIEHAKELLIIGKFTMSEIADRCGFENAYYFSTVFKKQVGISPKQYKTFKH